MRIYKNKITAFNLPIEIHFHTEPLIHIKSGYLKKSTVTIAFTAIKTDKMSIKTERLTEYNMHHQLRKLTETINRNGESQTVVCTPLREELIDENHKKELGYKSDVVLLNCDDGNQMKIQSKLEKSPTKGLANFTTKKNFMMKHNDINYKIEETRKLTIDTNGNIERIAENVKVTDLFSIKFRVRDVACKHPHPSL